MTGDAGGAEGPHWLVEPPGSQQINFQISAGDQVEVTPEVQAAVERLIQALRGDDVQGYVYDPKCTTKNVFCLPNYDCQRELQKPCLIDYQCQIGKNA